MDGQLIEIRNERTVYNRRFRISAIEFEMIFKSNAFDQINSVVSPTEKQSQLETLYQRCFNELLNYIANILAIRPWDFVGIKFQLPSVENTTPFGLRFLELQEISAEIITDLLMSVQQSNTNFATNSLINIVVTVVENQSGGSRRAISRLCLNNYEQLCKRKRACILRPKNEQHYTDKLCLMRAVVIGKHLADALNEKENNVSKNMRKYLNKLFNRNNKQLNIRVQKLVNKVFGSIELFNASRENGCTLSDLEKISKVLKNYQLVVYDDKHLYKRPIFRTKRINNGKKNQINIFYLKKIQHFLVLSNVKGFFGVKYQCDLCDKLLHSKYHKCDERCNRCFASPPCYFSIDQRDNTTVSTQIWCDRCNRLFRNQRCYWNHKQLLQEESKYTVCRRYSICKTCFKFIDSVQLQSLSDQTDEHKHEEIKPEKIHKCDEKYCFYCKKFTKLNHTCTIKPFIEMMPTKFVLFFYDLETVQDQPISVIKTRQNEVQFLHQPILVCCHQVCHECWKIDDLSFVCKNCEKREHIFEGKNCVRDFLELVLNYDKEIVQICCIAHNARSFDAQFLMSEILKIPNNNIKLLTCGFKILKIILKNYISFIDSLSFLPMALESFQKVFDLSEDFCKGYFPFLFLSFERWNYVGKLPEKHYFAVTESTNNKARVEKFNIWYDQQSKDNYNLRLEAIHYCSNDVSLLRLGCLRFMKLIIELAEINPFLQCITLAQLALSIYRKKYMKENTLGIVPHDMYHPDTNQSKICRKWLTYLNFFQPNISSVRPFMIQSEVRLNDCGISVDGFCKDYPFNDLSSSSSSSSNQTESKGTVFEFSGCYYHGCEKCIRNNPYKLQKHLLNEILSKNKRKKNEQQENTNVDEESENSDIESTNREMTDRGQLSNQNLIRTMAKLKHLKSLGYNVIHIWEHEFRAMLKDNPTLDAQISHHPFVGYSKLNARDGIYGGRNEAGCLYYKTKDNEKIKFVDFCSLYSYAMLKGKYFLREPKQIRVFRDCESLTDNDLMQMDGLAYATVLPKQNLYWPVLPYRVNGKLMFPLCRACVENLNINKCTHTVEERVITGVWSLCELKAAIQRGYKLMKVFEVWEYDYASGKDDLKTTSDNHSLLFSSYDDLVNYFKNKNTVTDTNTTINSTQHPNDNICGNSKMFNGLFTAYLVEFFTLKACASGFPLWCTTDKLKKKYIYDFWCTNGIFLDYNSIQKNPAKRAFAKLMLNALFGKLIQQEKEIQTVVLNRPIDLQFYLNSDLHQIMDCYCPNNNYVVITYKMVKPEDGGQIIDVNPLKPTSVARHICLTSGIQTTTTARLHLYSELEKLGERCFYMDTDSLLYLQRDENDYCPKLSDTVGGLTNEFEAFRKHNDFEPYCNEWVCCGPKTYALSIIVEDPLQNPYSKPVYVIKCKGLRLTNENSHLINMNTMKSFVLGIDFCKNSNNQNESNERSEIAPSNANDNWLFDKIVTNRKKIMTLKNFQVVTAQEKKLFGFTFDKRVCGENCKTYPFGYKAE